MNYATKQAVSLDNSALARMAPAIFASAPHDKMSERYSFVPTIAVIEALRSGGWSAVSAGQGRARDASRTGVQKHVVRLQHPDMMTAAVKVGDVVPQLVLTNSHDGSTSYQLHAGVFRLVCTNGLMVADSTFEKLSIRHSNVTPRAILDASFEVISDVPAVLDSVETMRALPVSTDEQRAFATAAASLRWEKDEQPIEAVQLLTTRRYEDRNADLWSTLNVVQENLVRGGLRGRNTSGKRQRTRGIDSVTEDTKINKALWRLADEMRKIKGAA